jgi:hypothetical protein
MLRLYDCKDVLKVASSHDSLVQLNLGPRRPAAGSAMVAIVFRQFAGLIAAALITPRRAAPIVMSVRVDTGVGGPTS